MSDWWNFSTDPASAATVLTETQFRLALCRMQRHVLVYWDQPDGSRRYECVDPSHATKEGSG